MAPRTEARCAGGTPLPVVHPARLSRAWPTNAAVAAAARVPRNCGHSTTGLACHVSAAGAPDRLSAASTRRSTSAALVAAAASTAQLSRRWRRSTGQSPSSRHLSHDPRPTTTTTAATPWHRLSTADRRPRPRRHDDDPGPTATATTTQPTLDAATSTRSHTRGHNPIEMHGTELLEDSSNVTDLHPMCTRGRVYASTSLPSLGAKQPTQRDDHEP